MDCLAHGITDGLQSGSSKISSAIAPWSYSESGSSSRQPKPDNDFRVVYDGTHGVQVNNDVVMRDRLESPGHPSWKL